LNSGLGVERARQALYHLTMPQPKTLLLYKEGPICCYQGTKGPIVLAIWKTVGGSLELTWSLRPAWATQRPILEKKCGIPLL
jgi:hypothetical protein